MAIGGMAGSNGTPTPTNVPADIPDGPAGMTMAAVGPGRGKPDPGLMIVVPTGTETGTPIGMDMEETGAPIWADKGVSNRMLSCWFVSPCGFECSWTWAKITDVNASREK
jgi:hypothetical protein